MSDLIYADLVEETTNTNGGGNIVPAGATNGHRSFAAVMSTGDQFYYSIDGAPANPAQWEVGIGTFNASGEIERQPIVSSVGTGAVPLAAGSKSIALSVAAEFYATVQAHDVFAAWQSLPGNGGKTVADFAEEVANPDTITLSQPVLSGSAFGRTLMELPAPVGMTNSQGGNDGVSTKIITNGGQFTQGPTSQPVYYDTITGFGLNMNSAFRAENAAMPTGSYRIESKFAQGQPDSKFGMEFHVASMFPVDTPTVDYRIMSSFAPHLSTDWPVHSDISYCAGRYVWADGSRRARVYLDLRPTTGPKIDLQGAAAVSGGAAAEGHPFIQFHTNNRQTIRQMNAAGSSFLPSIYRNGGDNHVLQDGALYWVGATQATPIGANAAMALNITSGAVNDRAVSINCPTVAGSFTVMESVGKCTAGEAIFLHYNNNAGSPVFRIQALSSRLNADPILNFRVGSGGRDWSIGVDNSNDDKLIIAASAAVGSSATQFVICDAAAGITHFVKPPRLPNVAIANLPSAATAGAGAMAYCTNESGGAVPVFSDGAAWRRMTDRAIVS